MTRALIVIYRIATNKYLDAIIIVFLLFLILISFDKGYYSDEVVVGPYGVIRHIPNHYEFPRKERILYLAMPIAVIFVFWIKSRYPVIVGFVEMVLGLYGVWKDLPPSNGLDFLTAIVAVFAIISAIDKFKKAIDQNDNGHLT